MESHDGVHGTPDPQPVTPPAEEQTASAAEPTQSGTPDAPPAQPTPSTETTAAPDTGSDDSQVVEGDLAAPDSELNPVEGETGPTVDNQMGDPQGLPPESFEADASDDKSLPHDQDQA